MTRDEIEAFFGRFRMPEEQICYYTDAILRFSPELREAFDEYAAGKDPELEIFGWTVGAVAAFAGCTYAEAFLYLDDMQRDPVYAERFADMEFGRK